MADITTEELEELENEVVSKDDNIKTMQEFVSPESLYQELIASVKKYHPSTDISLIEKAYKTADTAHKGQVRKSGEAYIIHPLCVAIILAELELDKETIVAGLLHDVVELAVAHDDLEEGGHGSRVAAEECHLVAFLYLEIDVVEKHLPIDTCLKPLDLHDLVAHFPFRGEDYAGIASRRRFYLLYVQLLEHLLAARGLLALGYVCAESLYELQELLPLLLGLFVGGLLLAQGELRRLVPEAVVSGKERYLVIVYVEGMLSLIHI